MKILVGVVVVAAGEENGEVVEDVDEVEDVADEKATRKGGKRPRRSRQQSRERRGSARWSRMVDLTQRVRVFLLYTRPKRSRRKRRRVGTQAHSLLGLYE